MANLNKIVYLSEEQKNTLFTTGSVTANGTTITYNPNDLYITPPAYDAVPTENSSNLITSGAVYAALDGLGEGTVTSITPGNGLINGTSGSSQAAITSSGTISLANITRTNNTSTASPTHAGTFTAIDSITTDAYGRVTAVNTKTVTLPSDNNTDTLVKQTAKSDNVNYKLLLTTTASPTSGTAYEANYGANLTYNPSTNILATGNLNLTGELDVTGNAYLRNETTINSLTAGSLLVNGATNFVQIPTAPTAAAGTKTTQIATTEFVNQAFAANDAMVFKGTLGADGTTQTVPANSYLKGWTYKVATAGIYAGEYCEVGDILIAINDGPASGASVINNDWAKVQGNIDGAVTGPSGAVNNHVAVFDGTTGKIIKDSGFTIEKNVPSNAVFTDTTYTFASGDANGQIKVTPSEGTAQNIDVTGLGDAAFYDIVPIEHGGTGNAYGYIRTGAQENSIIGEYATAEGDSTIASGDRSHAEGYYSTASGNSAHAEGQSLASGNYSHSESQSVASGISSHAEGIVTLFTNFPISGAAGTTIYERSDGGALNDTVVGKYITTSSNYANLSPTNPLVFKILSVNLEATPNKTLTVDRTMGALNGVTAHLIQYPEAAGDGSHVEGQGTKASGANSHAEGEGTKASGAHSHAEGANTQATGMNSHAEGTSNTAKGLSSHAEGLNTIAARRSQHTFGEYNIEDTQGSNEGSKGQYLEIVGNGTSPAARSNARTLDWNGNEVLAGKLTVGSAPTNNMDVTTKQYVDDLVSLTKAVSVTAVTWDNTNKKLTQTINGSTTDIVTPYWANLKLNNAASYNITPEMATIKLNGNTSASAASTKNVTLQYDASLEVLNFVFA